MTVALLKTVVGAHAHVNWHRVALHVREMVGCAGEVRRPAVGGEGRAWNVVAGAHFLQHIGVRRQDCAKLGVAVFAFTLGTVRSWIIQPSYQPLSLLMTNSPEMSVKTSLNARGLFGSIGSPGLGSSTTRTAPTVESPQLPPVTVNCTWSLIPGNFVVKTFGWKPLVSRR